MLGRASTVAKTSRAASDSLCIFHIGLASDGEAGCLQPAERELHPIEGCARSCDCIQYGFSGDPKIHPSIMIRLSQIPVGPTEDQAPSPSLTDSRNPACNAELSSIALPSRHPETRPPRSARQRSTPFQRLRPAANWWLPVRPTMAARSTIHTIPPRQAACRGEVSCANPCSWNCSCGELS